MKHLVTESAVYGVILVAGLVVIVANTAEASWDVLVKVLATVVVFWAAHLYAGTVAHLGDDHEQEIPVRDRLAAAARHSLDHSWGMLVAALVPVSVLLLGVANALDDQAAIWGTLWVAVAVLGVLGYFKVAVWTPRLSLRLASASIPSLLGLVLIALKVFVHY